jgi:site-specific DNA-methyltransferase (adenine-specific)
MKFHEVTNIFPLMSEQESDSLEADIAANGLRESVWMYKGKVIDGRNRARACEELGVKVPTQEWGGHGSLSAFVHSMNYHRRHLTDDQKAACAVEAKPFLEKEAKEREREGGRRGGKKAGRGRPNRGSQNSDDPCRDKNEGRSATQAGELFGVGRSRVTAAEKVKRADKKLFKDVKAGKVKLSQAKRQVERAAKKKALEEKAVAAPAPDRSWNIIHGDCCDELRKLTVVPRLIFGGGKKADQLSEYDFLLWASEWLGLCYEKLAPDGSLWALINNENAAAFELLLRGFTIQMKVGDNGIAGGPLTCSARFHIRARIAWFESFGVNQASNFNRCSRRLFWCVKDPRSFVFHREAVVRVSDCEAKYGDSRADPEGKIWDDVWGINPAIPRLVANAKERLPEFPTQLPLDLLLPIVGCASDPDDLVVDCFCGSGTTGEACIQLGRQFVGIEKNGEYVKAAEERLQGVRVLSTGAASGGTGD